ncbi:MAG: hypothetical protein JXA81_03270 [Sedimentisphaerales bacterium]|nr:hypothetical protein [Sedimentisphaerales bacterium]
MVNVESTAPSQVSSEMSRKQAKGIVTSTIDSPNDESSFTERNYIKAFLIGCLILMSAVSITTIVILIVTPKIRAEGYLISEELYLGKFYRYGERPFLLAGSVKCNNFRKFVVIQVNIPIGPFLVDNLGRCREDVIERWSSYTGYQTSCTRSRIIQVQDGGPRKLHDYRAIPFSIDGSIHWEQDSSSWPSIPDVRLSHRLNDCLAVIDPQRFSLKIGSDEEAKGCLVAIVKPGDLSPQTASHLVSLEQEKNLIPNMRREIESKGASRYLIKIDPNHESTDLTLEGLGMVTSKRPSLKTEWQTEGKLLVTQIFEHLDSVNEQEDFIIVDNSNGLRAGFESIKWLTLPEPIYKDILILMNNKSPFCVGFEQVLSLTIPEPVNSDDRLTVAVAFLVSDRKIKAPEVIRLDILSRSKIPKREVMLY